jgi:hypothetical protein
MPRLIKVRQVLRISRLNRSSVPEGSVAIAARQPVRLLSLRALAARTAHHSPGSQGAQR